MDHYELKAALEARAQKLEMPISAFSMLVLLEACLEFELSPLLERAAFWAQPLKKQLLLKPIKPNAFELNPLLGAWLSAESLWTVSAGVHQSRLKVLLSKIHSKGATGLTAVLWEDVLMEFLDAYATHSNQSTQDAILALAQAYLRKPEFDFTSFENSSGA